MSNHPSPLDVEYAVDHVALDTQNHDPPRDGADLSNHLEDQCGTLFDSPTSNNSGLVDEQSVPLPEKRKVCFFSSYSIFVILYLVFFLLIAYTYPLKPVCNIDEFYLAAFDKTTPNITQEWKDSLYMKIRFNNRNELISVSYDNFLSITIYYLPNSTTSIYFTDSTLPGFYQHKLKPMTIVVILSAPGISGLLKLQQANSTMIFRVDLDFSLRFHCRELGKHKHRFLMTADVEISLETGTTFIDTIIMSENSS